MSLILAGSPLMSLILAGSPLMSLILAGSPLMSLILAGSPLMSLILAGSPLMSLILAGMFVCLLSMFQGTLFYDVPPLLLSLTLGLFSPPSLLTPPPPLPPPPLTASLGDYDPETHKEGYTGEFEDFLLLPKNMRVCGCYGNITTLNYTVLTCKCTGKIQHLRRAF